MLFEDSSSFETCQRLSQGWGANARRNATGAQDAVKMHAARFALRRRDNTAHEAGSEQDGAQEGAELGRLLHGLAAGAAVHQRLHRLDALQAQRHRWLRAEIARVRLRRQRQRTPQRARTCSGAASSGWGSSPPNSSRISARHSAQKASVISRFLAVSGSTCRNAGASALPTSRGVKQEGSPLRRQRARHPR